MTQKEKYIQLSEKVKLPLAMQPWWLDIVSSEKGKGWDAIVVEDDKGEIIGAMPYHYVRKLWLTFVVQPQLTQHMGIWMKHLTEGKKVSEYDSVASKIIKAISDEVDRRGIFYLNMKLGIGSIGWQALEWNGFLCRVRYTYVMKEIPDSEDKIIPLFRENKRRLLKKAHDGNLEVRVNSISPTCLYDLYESQLKVKGQSVMFSKSLFCDLLDESIKRGNGGIVSVHDDTGTVHSAGAYFLDAPDVCQEECTYINPVYKDDGSSTLLIVEMMKEAKKKNCRMFNKGGGTNEGMARSYSGIGTERVAYLQIVKLRGWIGRLLMKLVK